MRRRCGKYEMREASGNILAKEREMEGRENK